MSYDLLADLALATLIQGGNLTEHREDIEDLRSPGYVSEVGNGSRQVTDAGKRFHTDFWRPTKNPGIDNALFFW